MKIGSRVFFVCALFAFSFLARSAAAETWEAPLGAHSLALGADRVACKSAPLDAGWSIEADGHSLHVPTADDAIGKVVDVKVAPNDGACAASTSSLSVIAIGPRAAADSIAVDPDGGRVVVQGRRLRGSALRWTAGTRAGSDTCASQNAPPSANVKSAPSIESCAFAVPRDLPVDPSALKVAIFPSGSRVVADGVFFDPAGKRLPDDAFDVPLNEITLHQVVATDASVDLSSGVARVPLSHPDAVSAVSCVDATCELSGNDLVVRGERGGDDKLEVHFQLRPHIVFRETSGAADSAPVVMLPLQRCPVSIASAVVVADADNERVVLRVDGTCARADGDLVVTTGDGTARVERTEIIGGSSYSVVRIPRVESDSLVVTVRKRDTILGTARAPTRRFTWRAKLEIADGAAIDFIPTNRFARVLLPPPPKGTSIVVRPIDGVYEAKHDGTGDWVRGVDGASGSTPLRLALIDTSLPDALAGISIAEQNEPVDRALRSADVPVALGARTREKKPLVEIVCGDGEGHSERIPIATTVSIPYRARDTCQLIFHREQLTVEDGAQTLRVSVTVTGSDGATKNDGRLDERIVLRRADHPFYMAIGGATDPFDRIVVRVGNSSEGTDQQSPEESDRRAPQAQWSLVTATSHARLYGTTAIPTGLFRLADTGHSGILTLSVGAILRLVALSRDGDAFPLGLEAGVMWLGIAGDTDPSVNSHGVVALVAGPGIAVPIANVSRASQTSINLHAWFEYEVSREVLNQQGQSFGFVFGPSISIGDIGANF
ncbi:MAG: hypothetical protein ABI183_20195 [Polyangiaceae bacterium]